MPRRTPMMPPIARCRRCPATHALAVSPLTDIDAAFAELHALEWLDMAWKDRGREKWAWACPTCKPSAGKSNHVPSPLGANADETREMAKELSALVTDAVKAKGLKNARVRSEVNARGELVVALLVPPTYAGQWVPS